LKTIRRNILTLGGKVIRKRNRGGKKQLPEKIDSAFAPGTPQLLIIKGEGRDKENQVHKNDSPLKQVHGRWRLQHFKRGERRNKKEKKRGA